MLRAVQQASQAMSEHKTGEPSPNNGRDRNSILLDDPDKLYVLGIGTSHQLSRESHSTEDFCPGRVQTSCATNEFGPREPRGSYSQPNISPGVEFRQNGRVRREPTGCGFNDQKVLSSIPESLNGDYETVRSTLEK